MGNIAAFFTTDNNQWHAAAIKQYQLIKKAMKTTRRSRVEVKAANEYRLAKARGVILVSQTW